MKAGGPATYSEADISFEIKNLGKSLCGLDIPIIIVKKVEKGIILSGSSKKIIVMTGRSHPGESSSSYLLEGFLDKILN